MAGVYVRLFYAKDDDPAGFIALCIVATFISVVIATAAGVFGRTLQKAVDLKSKNDLTV
jgi:Flp pilus assembly pilin Flp